MESSHWLIDLAHNAGFKNVEQLELPLNVSIVEAWKTVEETCELDSGELAKQVAAHFQLPPANFNKSKLVTTQFITEAIARKYTICPIRKEENNLVVATCDPGNLEAEQSLWFTSGRTPLFEIASPEVILEIIDACYSQSRTAEFLLKCLDTVSHRGINLSCSEVGDEDKFSYGRAVYETIEVRDAPVTTLANLILQSAVLDGASDIHIEPERDFGLVRFRLDGVLRYRLRLPINLYNNLVARFKVMGELDIADHLKPQDGRTRIRVGKDEYTLRISSIPTCNTEKVVVRLHASRGQYKLNDLQLLSQPLAHFRHLLSYRDGIVIVTGPTGSGKTTTLYTALNEMVTGEENIVTVEDPIEYEMPGVTQIQVEPKQGVTFAVTLRHILRQDPDVIFVGEIRDLETAEMAVRAAMTGHLVLSTLHTNDAVSTVVRMENMGLPRYLIGETLRGALAQRLVRRVCSYCATKDAVLSPEDRYLAEHYKIESPLQAVGCRWCERTGYNGRIPVAEVMRRTPELQEQITAGASPQVLQKLAVKSGMQTMRESALQHVSRGETTLLEVRRIIGEIAESLVGAPGVDYASTLKRQTLEIVIDKQQLVLPGLLKRDEFCQQFRKFVDSDVDSAVSLAIIDIDRMKVINEKHGRHVGNKILRETGSLLAKQLPEQTIVCHWQGNEFVVLFPNTHAVQSAAELRQVLDKLRKINFDRLPKEVQATFSAGVVDISGIHSAPEAVARADRFLYRAKSLGGNRVLAGLPSTGLLLRQPARRQAHQLSKENRPIRK